MRSRGKSKYLSHNSAIGYALDVNTLPICLTSRGERIIAIMEFQDFVHSYIGQNFIIAVTSITRLSCTDIIYLRDGSFKVNSTFLIKNEPDELALLRAKSSRVSRRRNTAGPVVNTRQHLSKIYSSGMKDTRAI